MTETKLHIRCFWPPGPPIISGVHHSIPSTPDISIPSLALLFSIFCSIRCFEILASPITFTMNPEWYDSPAIFLDHSLSSSLAQTSRQGSLDIEILANLVFKQSPEFLNLAGPFCGQPPSR